MICATVGEIEKSGMRMSHGDLRKEVSQFELDTGFGRLALVPMMILKVPLMLHYEVGSPGLGNACPLPQWS